MTARPTNRRIALRDDGPALRCNARLRAALEDAEVALAADRPARQARIETALAIIRAALDYRGET